jgi:tRNA pseudouridine32 synthase/23S rRNA pseudouridine746 synthase
VSKVRHQTLDVPAAAGFCPDCGTVHSLGTGNSRRYALELMEQLKNTHCIDDGSDPVFSTDVLFSESRGHMFGVLECKGPDGNTIVLKAFSGQYNGRWLVDGWVPPIIDVDDFDRLVGPADREIKQLDRQIAETNDRELIRKRKWLSQELMKQLHACYQLTNFRGETRPLTTVFPTPGIPTGTGDCCAPKLLNYAAKNGLRPVGLSEFYWGRENRSGTRQHKQFYPACAEKCRPILGFMLCGIAPPTNHTNLHESKPKIDLCEFVKIRGQKKAVIEVIYEKPEFVVVNKPSGLLAVPGKGEANKDCVVSRIRALYPDCIDQPAVHRLDMDTSGLMVLALTADAHRELSRQFEHREAEKCYIALLDGELSDDQGTIELPFRLDVDNRPLQIHDPVHGKTGITHWRKLAVENGKTRVEFFPITGRTHQLRVHAASEHGLGIPILGDRLYGSGTAPGQLKLHASYLSVKHPRTDEKLEFRSPPPF